MRDPKHPRQFTEDFKRQIVALVDSSKPRAEVMREYDLGKSTLDRRIQRLHACGSTAAADNRTPEQNRLIELERENARLKMEVDVLKQAALYSLESDGDGGERRPLPGISAVPHPRRAALYLLPHARQPARTEGSRSRSRGPVSPSRGEGYAGY